MQRGGAAKREQGLSNGVRLFAGRLLPALVGVREVSSGWGLPRECHFVASARARAWGGPARLCHFIARHDEG